MPDCQIYLVSPPAIDDLDAFAKTLRDVLDAVPVAAFQLRLKGQGGEIADSSVVVQAAEAIFPMLRDAGTVALMNDSVDLASRTGADGVHLGQGDGSVADARAALGRDAVIGVTCHTSKDLAFEAVSAGADYVAFGAFFPTPTKTPPSAFGGEDGLELLSWWQEAMTTPCVAIGGITPGNAASLVGAGADFLAVSSGVWSHAAGPVSAARSLWELCRAG